LDGLPDKYKLCDEIPVIRASTTPPQSIRTVADEISWATSYKCAAYYYEGKMRLSERKNRTYFYIGKIRKEDIISINFKSYFEIVQVGAVKDNMLVPRNFVRQNIDRDVEPDDFLKVREKYGDLALALSRMSIR